MKKKIIIGVLFVFVLTGASCFIGVSYFKSTLINYYHVFNAPNLDIESLKASGKIWGIDISHHQKRIDWSKFEGDDKPDFVFLKATEGVTHKDSKYLSYKSKFQKLGIPVGAYHFFSTASGGKQQAEEFIRFADLDKGNLLPVLDFEKTGGKSTAYLIKELQEFITTIENHYGVKPIIYCDYGFAKRFIPEIDEMVIWASDFHFEPRCSYMIWQKTDKFKHPAFLGTVDFNVVNNRTKSVIQFAL